MAGYASISCFRQLNSEVIGQYDIFFFFNGVKHLPATYEASIKTISPEFIYPVCRKTKVTARQQQLNISSFVKNMLASLHL